MSTRYRWMATTIAAVLMGSLFGGCGWMGGNGRILMAILTEELLG